MRFCDAEIQPPSRPTPAASRRGPPSLSPPGEAARELEHAVTELGFVGALIDNHPDNGTSYDGPAYRVFRAKTQEVDVPVYIHPTAPEVHTVFGINQGAYAPVGDPGGPDTF
ncbi:hypothetical protein DL770_003955 [Monosporascus sp. CRB-9-2]|nr:hypothetical protein DL770_003955 [Monosporascus sp. CRB-9-2]